MKSVYKTNLIYILVLSAFYIPVIYVFYQIFLMKDLFFKLFTFITSNAFLKTLSFSISQAGLTAMISIILALPGAYFSGRFHFKGKQLGRSLLVLPFMMPGIVIVLGLVIFYGQNGVLNQLLKLLFSKSYQFTALYGFWGIVLAHVVYNLPLAIRMLSESWERIDPKLREASINLGASPFFTWSRLTVPLMASTIGSLFLIIFTYSFLSFTVVLVFGGYLFKTFEVLIYIEYNSKLRFEQATMIAGLQTAVLVFFFWLQSLMQHHGYSTKPVLKLPSLRFRSNPFQATWFYSYLTGVVLFLATPFLTILWRSFLKGGTPGGMISLDNYRLLFTEAFRFTVGQAFVEVIVNSLLLSTSVTVITSFVAYIIARKRRSMGWGPLDLMLQLPFGISFMSFGFGLGSLLGNILPPWMLVAWAHIYLAFPIVYSILRTAWRDFDESMLESSLLLGASPRFTFFRIETPLIRKAIQTALAYGMAISLSDLAAVLLLGQGEVITISAAIYRLIGHYRFAQATALASILIGIAFFIFLAIETGWKSTAERGNSI